MKRDEIEKQISKLVHNPYIVLKIMVLIDRLVNDLRNEYKDTYTHSVEVKGKRVKVSTKNLSN